jgi:hypothetical protein
MASKAQILPRPTHEAYTAHEYAYAYAYPRMHIRMNVPRRVNESFTLLGAVIQVALCPAGVLPQRVALGSSRFVSVRPCACTAFLLPKKTPLQEALGVATRVKGVATLGPVGQWTVSYRNPRVQPCGAEGPKNPSIHHEGAIDSIET